ncbi:MAG: glycosyltransferase family 2 protein [Calditrichaeota bacterium]|nr:glycosyltransferase family 2 protein [Calditrichota bacterium]
MKISVIIVTYNHEGEIVHCLQSLQESPLSSAMQILLIDNRSRDRTLDVITSFSKNFAEFEIIKNKENFGFTRAVNQGLRIAGGDFVLLLNPDTIIPEKTIPRLIEHLTQNSAVGAVSPQFRNPDGSIQPSCRRFPRRRDVGYNALGLNLLFSKSKEFNYWKMGDFDHQQLRKVEQPQGAFLLFRREIFDKIGFFDEQFFMFFSDVDWCRRIIKAGWKIHFFSDVHIVHARGSSVHRHQVKMIKTSHLSFYRYFQKYYRGIINQALNYGIGVFLLFLMIVRIISYYLRPKKA